jgi:hypothetical protein
MPPRQAWIYMKPTSSNTGRHYDDKIVMLHSLKIHPAHDITNSVFSGTAAQIRRVCQAETAG